MTTPSEHGAITRQPPGMAAVREAVAVLGLDHDVLWVDYLTMTGEHSYRDFVGALDGRGELSAGEYNKLAAALNDRFTEQGLDHPVAYFEDPVDQDGSAGAE